MNNKLGFPPSVSFQTGPDRQGIPMRNSLIPRKQNKLGLREFHINLLDLSTDKSTGAVTLNATSPGSDTCLSYTPTTTIDNRALAKAEAEYEHKLKQIE